jgi:hypothetical protein
MQSPRAYCRAGPERNRPHGAQAARVQPWKAAPYPRLSILLNRSRKTQKVRFFRVFRLFRGSLRFLYFFSPTLDRRNSLGRKMIGSGMGKRVCNRIPLPDIPLPIFLLSFLFHAVFIPVRVCSAGIRTSAKKK